MGITMRVLLMKVKDMDKEFIFTQMEMNLMGIGSRIKE